MSIPKPIEGFTPFKARETHWGESDYRPLIPNVATVLPPGLPEPILKILLLRMQLEEANYQIEHIDKEAEYAAWCEDSLDLVFWSGNVKNALQSRAKDIITKDIKNTLDEIEKMFPNFLEN